MYSASNSYSYGTHLPPSGINLSRRKGSTASSSITSDDRFWAFLGFLLILVPWGPYHFSVRPHLNYVRDDIANMQRIQKQTLADLQKTTKKVQKLNAESSTLEEENNALLFDLREHGDTVDTENNRYREGEEHEEALLARIDALQSAIQKRSKDAVVKT